MIPNKVHHPMICHLVFLFCDFFFFIFCLFFPSRLFVFYWFVGIFYKIWDTNRYVTNVSFHILTYCNQFLWCLLINRLFYFNVVEMINFFLCGLGFWLSLTLKGITIKIFFSSKNCFSLWVLIWNSFWVYDLS